MSIKSKLMLLLALPLIGLILISTKSIVSDLSYKSNSETLYIGIELSTRISKLVHELQKERGMTAGFIGSYGKKFVSQLPQQREHTNDKVTELKKYLQLHNFSTINETIYAMLEDSLIC